MKKQGGGFALGLVAGVMIGLALALGVALYITKVPVPFVDKVPQRTPEQDAQEAERNKNWNPNGPLSPQGTGSRPAVATSASAAAPAASGRDPAAILSGAPATMPSTATGVDAFIYFVQVGAYRRAEDAETQRAQLAIQGLTARITEREQAGRTVYRVRLGPIETRAEADGLQQQLHSTGLDGQLVRVQRP